MADTRSCVAYRPILDDIVADEVDGVTLARFESHLSACPDCRFALAQARAYRRLMHRVGMSTKAPHTLRSRAAELMRPPRKPQP